MKTPSPCNVCEYLIPARMCNQDKDHCSFGKVLGHPSCSSFRQMHPQSEEVPSPVDDVVRSFIVNNFPISVFECQECNTLVITSEKLPKRVWTIECPMCGEGSHVVAVDKEEE